MIYSLDQSSKKIKTKVGSICFHNSFIVQQLKSFPIKFRDLHIYQLSCSQVMWVPGYEEWLKVTRPIFRH